MTGLGPCGMLLLEDADDFARDFARHGHSAQMGFADGGDEFFRCEKTFQSSVPIALRVDRLQKDPRIVVLVLRLTPQAKISHLARTIFFDAPI